MGSKQEKTGTTAAATELATTIAARNGRFEVRDYGNETLVATFKDHASKYDDEVCLTATVGNAAFPGMSREQAEAHLSAFIKREIPVMVNGKLKIVTVSK